MRPGELVRFISGTSAITLEDSKSPEPTQVQIWPRTSYISAGEIGVVLKTSHYEELGSLSEILIGNVVFLDIPISNIETLPTTAA
jgi:hypothetical protein